MRFIRILLTLLIILAILLLAKAAHADGGYSQDQLRVISKIYQACQRYNVNCTIPLAIARRETQFGANRQGDWSSYKGRYQSVGIYQWHENGLGSLGEYYQQYGLAWRWNEYLDIDMGVRLTTQHIRGTGPNLIDCTCGWWTPAGINPYNLPARPGYVASPVAPVVSSTSEPAPTETPAAPLPTLAPHKQDRLDPDGP